MPRDKGPSGDQLECVFALCGQLDGSARLEMDEQSLNELLECSVCLERLDHTSKVLPCQHTFCRRCLDEIVSTKHELRCPECRNVVTSRVEDLPSNILLIRLLEGLKTVNVVGSSTGRTGSPGRVSSTSTPRRHDHQGGSSSSSSANTARHPRPVSNILSRPHHKTRHTHRLFTVACFYPCNAQPPFIHMCSFHRCRAA